MLQYFDTVFSLVFIFTFFYKMDMSKKAIKALIEMYWERKCLWQVRSEDYNRRDSKKRAYQEIVTFLRRNGVQDANEKLVRDKIQNLRRALRKEKKKIDDSGGTYSPTLWYYDLLSFVNEQHENNSNASFADSEKLYIECDSNFDSSDDDQNKELDKKVDSANETNIISSNPVEKCLHKPDEYEAMGINVAAKVRRMELTQQVYAELLIQKVLARGLLGQLSDRTELMDLVPDDGSIVRLGLLANAEAYRNGNSENSVNRNG